MFMSIAKVRAAKKMTSSRCRRLCALSARDPILRGGVHSIFFFFARDSVLEVYWI